MSGVREVPRIFGELVYPFASIGGTNAIEGDGQSPRGKANFFK